MKKQKILISNGNPYIFRDSLFPIIPEISKYFEVFLITTDFHYRNHFDKPYEWKKNGIINDFFIYPYEDTFKQFLVLKSNQEYLSSLHFDVFVTGDEIHPISRYLLDCVIPDKCLRILLYYAPSSYLYFKNVSIGKQITEAYRKNQGIQKKLVESIPSALSEKQIQKSHYERNIIAPLFFGKAFPFFKYDNLTRISSGKYADLILMHNEEDADAHKLLLNKKHIYSVEYPTAGLCRCNTVNERNSILLLIPQSAYTSRISKEMFEHFIRDVIITVNESGAKSVHLRPHPRDEGLLPKQLTNYLNTIGIQTELKRPEQPVYEIICSYIGIAGMASGSFLDAGAACQYAFVVGFESISSVIFNKYYISDPKSHYERSQVTINWIESTGKYDPIIFKRQKRTLPTLPSIPDFILKFSGNRN